MMRSSSALIILVLLLDTFLFDTLSYMYIVVFAALSTPVSAGTLYIKVIIPMPANPITVLSHQDEQC